MIYIFYKKHNKIYLIRPLLKINRFEIFKLSCFWKLPIFVDLTNNLLNFRRNRLRQQIFPILKFFFNPKLEMAINRFIETANFEKNYFQHQLYKINHFLKIQKIKNQKFFIYLPYVIKKLMYQHLFFFYFKDNLSYEIDYLLKLVNLDSYKDNLK